VRLQGLEDLGDLTDARGIAHVVDQRAEPLPRLLDRLRRAAVHLQVRL
jgi:hypothetical protein